MILNYDHYRTGQRKRRARAQSSFPFSSGSRFSWSRPFIIFHVPARLFGPSLAHRSRPGKLPDLFKAEKYDDVIAAANATLRGDPLNTVALSYKGFASFYLAVAQNTTEERMPLLDQAIVSLRRARLVGTPFAGETDYVLGKAYLNKGKYYYDLAISSMESSLAKGYVQKDSHEYIGQAYTQLGDYEKGLDHFLTALKDRFR